jgi:hypothetical protein
MVKKCPECPRECPCCRKTLEDLGITDLDDFLEMAHIYGVLCDRCFWEHCKLDEIEW